MSSTSTIQKKTFGTCEYLACLQTATKAVKVKLAIGTLTLFLCEGCASKFKKKEAGGATAKPATGHRSRAAMQGRGV